MSHGLYDADRPATWPMRLRGVIASISTALVLAVTISYFLGDQAFSRLWFASGWLFAVAGTLIWRSAAHRLYVALHDTLAPSRRVLIVGANTLGVEVASE